MTLYQDTPYISPRVLARFGYTTAFTIALHHAETLLEVADPERAPQPRHDVVNNVFATSVSQIRLVCGISHQPEYFAGAPGCQIFPRVLARFDDSIASMVALRYTMPRLYWQCVAYPGFCTIDVFVASRGIAMVPPMTYHDIPTASHGRA